MRIDVNDGGNSGLKNFKMTDMNCKGNPKEVPAVFTTHAYNVLIKLQKLRDIIGAPIYINSGYRHMAYHTELYRKLGQPVVRSSQHLVAAGVDISWGGGKSAEEIIRIGKSSKVGFQFAYDISPTAVHFDLRVKDVPAELKRLTSGGPSVGYLSGEPVVSMSGEVLNEPSSEIGIQAEFNSRKNEIEIYSWNTDLNAIVIPYSFTTINDVATYLKIDVNVLKKINNRTSNDVFTGETILYPKNSNTSSLILAGKYADLSGSSLDLSKQIVSSNMKAWDEALIIKASSSTVSSEQTRTTKLSSQKEELRRQEIGGVMYSRAAIVIASQKRTNRIEFLVSPSGFSETRGNLVVPQRTSGGWFISRHGENLINISLNGYMLDTPKAKEKHAFMEDYKNNVIDKKNSSNEYFNDSVVILQIEGQSYTGYITGLAFQKSAMQSFLYSYNLSFLGVGDLEIESKSIESPDKDKIQVATSKPGILAGETQKVISPANKTVGTVSPKASAGGIFYVTASALNVRSSPNGTILKTIPKGTEVTVTERQGSWAKIGEGQWVSNNYLSANSPSKTVSTVVATQYKVTALSLNVRNSPNPSATILKVLKQGSLVRIFEESGNWAKIDQNKSWWVSKSYLDISKPVKAPLPLRPGEEMLSIN